jgi:molecular chaperone DnaK (HSP70)
MPPSRTSQDLWQRSPKASIGWGCRRGSHPGSGPKGEVKDVLLLDVTPIAGDRDPWGRIYKIDRAQYHYTDKESQIFSTAQDNQTAVSIRVFKEIARWRQISNY